jgi:hypothetical protein
MRPAVSTHDLRRGRRIAARAVDEGKAAIRPEQEADADVAAGSAAVLIVLRVDLAVFVMRTAGGLDCVDQEIPGR